MFTRSEFNPIITPDKQSVWQSEKIYNCGALYLSGIYHLFYRAVGDDSISRIGLAKSADGENFTLSANPILKPGFDHESKGLEDPRVTKINNEIYLAYTAYDGETARLSLAFTKKFKAWTKLGLVFPALDIDATEGFTVPWDKSRTSPRTNDDWSKAGALFSEEINDYYCMLFGDSNIWLAKSENLHKWHVFEEPLIKPRPDFFDSAHVEMGPPPIKTDIGWLVLYHGIDSKMVYRLGAVILDLNNPEKILKRTSRPIFEPQAEYELDGVIDLTHDTRPKVIFCCGAAVVNGRLRIYYGAGDKYVCTAAVGLDKLLDSIV